MKIIAIVQARMSSSRLPGKVLMPIAGKPMVERVLERVKMADTLSDVVLATSDHESDSPIIEALPGEVKIFRGSLPDVLDRYYFAALQYNADIVVRITGDCPLIDPLEIDKAVARFTRSGCDYLTNDNQDGFAASGFDIEVFSWNLLMDVHGKAKGDQREHVIAKYQADNPFSIKTCFCVLPSWCYKHKLSVDTEDEYIRVDRIFTALYEKNPRFTVEDVRQFMGIPR